MIDFQLLERLLELLNKSSADSIEIRKSFWTTTVRVSKSGASGNSGPVTYHVAAAPPPPQVQAGGSAPSAPAGPGGGAAAGAPPAAHLLEIKSPMVGTFYAKPEPGADPYVRVGSRISSGQTLCIIEAMKIMNPL